MTSAEQRAKELLRALERNAGLATRDEQIDRITSAIREAENAKLEEVASWFEEQAKIVKGRPYLKEFPASISGPICEILDGIPADIRSLISKKD